MLFVWAQFELQVGIMCASAPALRVFFRRYLGTTQGSSNNSDSQGTIPTKSITVVHDTTIKFDNKGAATRPFGKLESHELRDFATPASEDGEDELLRDSRAQERDLTRYSHEESHIGISRSSWINPTTQLSEAKGPQTSSRR
jgi:hypothetical protein